MEKQIEGLFQPPEEVNPTLLALGDPDHPERVVHPRVRVFPRLGLALGFVDREHVSGLEHSPHIDEVQPAEEVSLVRPVAMRATQKPKRTTWGISRLNVPRLWKLEITGKGVRVGHLDTGIDATHPALSKAVAAYRYFDRLGNPVPGAPPTDSGTHGTHTAGTIAGRPTNGEAIGVAPGADLVVAHVIEGGNVVERILGGLEWMIEERVRVVNLSLGLRGFTPAFQILIDALRAQGVLPVVAVGNEGPGTSRSPGNYGNVLSVGAIDRQNAVASFSGSQRFAHGSVPKLVAPGVGVVSSAPGGKYVSSSGTSMAAPHVSGLAALLMQAVPSATIDDVENAIIASCRLVGSMTAGTAGAGLPDAVRAYAVLQASPSAAPRSGPRTATG
ncbi:S8 family peptidase [Salinarimonas sp.]|uniref:S8 family peptidase n=1 Tax=Salinarimonas sp. TaxID=2766526 RepID=UPI00391C6DCC